MCTPHTIVFLSPSRWESVHRLEIFVWPTLASVRCAFCILTGNIFGMHSSASSLSHSMSIRRSCMQHMLWRSRLSFVRIFLSDYVPFFAYHSFDAFFLLLRFILSIQSGRAAVGRSAWIVALQFSTLELTVSYVWISSSLIHRQSTPSTAAQVVCLRWNEWWLQRTQAKWNLLGANFMHRIYFLQFFVTFSTPSLPPSRSLARSTAHQFISTS